jgi:ribosome-binding protein aMBF1 (putative translation factor)
MNCELCGSEIKTIPAGVSKATGRAYASFQVCSNRGCSWKPPKTQKPLETASLPARTQTTTPLPVTNDSVINATILKVAGELVCARLRTSEVVENPVQEIINIYNILLHELK